MTRGQPPPHKYFSYNRPWESGIDDCVAVRCSDEVRVSRGRGQSCEMQPDAPPRYDDVCSGGTETTAGASPSTQVPSDLPPSYVDYIRSLHTVVVVHLTADRRRTTS